ncbi:MAG: hypothetical protein K6L81_00790 [Agarilytica sp.]
MKITLVKKILKDGSLCKKCIDVGNKLESSGHIARIDEVVLADERDPESAGIALAREHNVNFAPFFIVEKDGEAPVIYTVYMKFLKEVLEQETKEADELKDIMDNQDLDFL